MKKKKQKKIVREFKSTQIYTVHHMYCTVQRLGTYKGTVTRYSMAGAVKLKVISWHIKL